MSESTGAAGSERPIAGRMLQMNDDTRVLVEQLVARSELNRLPEKYGGGPIFGRPLLGVARGDDQIFQVFKEVVGPDHLTPAEMWIASDLPKEEGLMTRLRVLSIVFPFDGHIREAGARNHGDMPPELYCVARNYASSFMDGVMRRTARFLVRRGFRASSGVRSKAFQIVSSTDPYQIHSTWSERHVAFAAGLGTFSLHEALITEAGCNVRLASLITDAPLDVTLRKSDEPYGNCRHYATGECGECIRKCPAGAITSAGHDKQSCNAYNRKVAEEMSGRGLNSILKTVRTVINDEIRLRHPVGCALCQFGVPCTDKNPMAPRRPRGE